MLVDKKLVLSCLFVIWSWGSFAENDLKPTYNVLLLGQSGAGKSSLINMFYNYLREIPYDEPWEIVIPLKHDEISYFVNVEEYKKYKVELQPDGSSQTKEIHQYTVTTKNEIIVLWDTPGFGDTEGFLKDKENADNIVNAISDVSFNAIFVAVGSSKDTSRISETNDFQNSINYVRGMLPKSFSKGLVGVFNREGTTDPVHKEGLKTKFLNLFKMTAQENEFKACNIDGGGFFDKMSRKTGRAGSTLNKAKWEEDGLAFEDMLQAIRASTPVSGYEALKIHQVVYGLEGWVLYLSDTIAEQQKSETQLATLQTSLKHEKQRRDTNSNHRKTSPAEYAQVLDFWPGRRLNPYMDKGVAYERALRIYYEQTGQACDNGGRCDIKIKDSEQWDDEFQLGEYNAALKAITDTNNKIIACENKINGFKDKRKEIVGEIVKVQKKWEDLAMTTDLTPMIRKVEKEMREIDGDVKKLQPVKDRELSVLRQIRDVYYDMQKKTPDL